MSVLFSKPQGPFTLSHLAHISSCEIHNDSEMDRLFDDIMPLHLAKKNHISFLHNKKYSQSLSNTQAGACIIKKADLSLPRNPINFLIHENPYKAYALIAQAFYPNRQKNTENIAPTSHIASSASIGSNCSISHFTQLDDNVAIGRQCEIGAHTYIGENVQIGDNCIIENNVIIKNAIIGNNVHIYSGCCIGEDGFGFASDSKGHYRIPHKGGVIIGNHVSIGNNTCIDRGSVNNTEIGDWCQIDNLVQIAHNVKIGSHSILCAQVGIAGSSIIGSNVVLAGKVGVVDNIKIADSTVVLSGSGIIKDIPSKDILMGYPAINSKKWHKINGKLRNLLNCKK